nr:hypothetical protein [uncultured Devosia sp.]
MADSIYACDQIRRNLNPDISGSTWVIGWHGVAAHRGAWSVVAL